MSEENCLACSPTAAYCVPTPHPTPSPTLRPSLSPTTLSPTTPQPTPRPTRSPTLRPTQFPTVSPYPTITPTTTSLCCFYWESSDPCDCEPLNSAKSGFCVLSEENCLICSPTAAFCAAPPTPMLTMPPTRRPTAKTTTTTTTTTCADSSDWYKASEPEKDCSWVSSFTEARCVVKGEDETFAYQSCPSSCSTCETECEGDDPEFYVTDPSKDCTWVGQARTVRCKKEGTTGYAYAQCKHACGLCAYEECTDDDDAWQMPGDPSKDCDWVGDFRQNRCVKVGADGTYAYESCRHSCKSCAETLTGSCSDSTSWFKKDDPSKDCDWVGNLLPTRCAVKGDDDTWAFEGYWDCCKPSCAWSGKGNVDTPVRSCEAETGNVLSNPNVASVCDGGTSASCADNQPFTINDELSMGFAAAAVGGVSGLNGDENCGMCYELVWTDEEFAYGGGAHPNIVGKRHVIQVTNIGYDVSGSHSFDLQIPGAGQGIFDTGCEIQFPDLESEDFDCGNNYGGCSDVSGCADLPVDLRAGCEWRFDSSVYGWKTDNGKSDNPFVRFRRVKCPSELVAITGTTPNDDDDYPVIAYVTSTDAGSSSSPTPRPASSPTPRPASSPTPRPVSTPATSNFGSYFLRAWVYGIICPGANAARCVTTNAKTYWVAAAETNVPDAAPGVDARRRIEPVLFLFSSEENCLACNPAATFCASSTTCADSSDWYKASEPEKDCSWVSSFTEARCVVKGEDETFAYQSCPSSCSTCETECEGDDPEFYVADPSKGCTWVGQARTVRCKKEGTTGYAYARCKHACGLCTYADCTDDDDDVWHMNGDPAKNCDWVGDFRQNRCVNQGEDGTYAYESCRHSCKSCAETLTGSCSDRTSWYKKGDPAKDCDWVGGHWNCCKPSCAWSGRGSVDTPVRSCEADTGDVLTDPNVPSVCDGGTSAKCADNQPFKVSEELSMGFASAASVGDVDGLSGDENCGMCYELVWSDEENLSARHVIQVTDVSEAVAGSFDLFIPGAGRGLGCEIQYPDYEIEDFDCNKSGGGCDDISSCAGLPAELFPGCAWRFDAFGRTTDESANVRFRRVKCPSELVAITGATPSDDDDYPEIEYGTQRALTTDTNLCCFYWESSDPFAERGELSHLRPGRHVLHANASPDATPDALSHAVSNAEPNTITDPAPDAGADAASHASADAVSNAIADDASHAISDARAHHREHSSDWYKASEPQKDCAWVSSFSEARCVVKGEDQSFAYSSCPASCSTCETECEGDDANFYVTDPSKDCTWVGHARTVRCKKTGTTGYAYAQCKHACGLCYYADCTDDDDDWQMPGDPSRDCDWVGDFRQNRCVKVGADGTYAYESCRHSCKSCAQTLAGSCSDDASWYKKGDPAKDCDWVGNLLPTRCVVKGEDDTWAFEACPFTCDVC
ncbi:hypothetical protein CTAYLR_008855 [Chrysophaeum taylorii]|uniref:cellulase n=1 Tax=Chrysophaeum taylorii TaxID=2483200 RepID=A0AAD7UQ18_9STRA|nr:hypothetical protein CTAYLR_008855 [Chrysophaeum taylorii]